MDIKILALTVLIHACLSLKNFQLDSQYESQYESQSQSTTGDFPFPGNYTLREVIATQVNPKNVLLSPDQNWLLYQDQYSSNSTTFYFRHRRSFESKSIKLGNDKFDDLKSWKFNKRGDLLFAGTYYGFVYMCNFSENMTDSDCQARFSFNRTVGLYSFSINEANQLALGIRDQFYVLTLSESGALVSVASRYFSGVIGGIRVSWHPQHSDMVIIGSCKSPSQMKGFISFFNITTNSSQDRQLQTCVSQMIVFNKENIIITLNAYYVLDAFLYEGTNLTPISINKDLQRRSISLSVNENLFIGQDEYEQVIQVFTVTKLVSPLGTKHEGKLNATNDFSGIQLALVYSQQADLQYDCSFSDDGNQYLISYFNRPLIQVYSMCPRGTYYATQGCFKCAVNCSACHITIDTCTDCLNNTFALFNGSCLSCGVYLAGCLTCSNAHSCFSCDKKNNFGPDSVNGSCICKDFYFLSNGKCEPCQPYTACKVCVSETLCTECDLYKGYKQKPVDSSCVCRRQFSTVNNTCVECDIEGCERCENANVCLFCSQSQGYEPDVGMDGMCVKKNSYSLVIILSIIGGCALIGIAIYVYCKLRKRKSDAKQELKEEPDFEERGRESSEIHRLSVPKFEEIEEMIKQSVEKQIKVEPIPVVDKKEYAKFSDAQKIRLRQLLKESLLSNR